MTDHFDWIQAAVIARAKALGLTAQAIADATGGKVTRQHVHTYLTKRSSMGSHKLQHVLTALSLGLDAPQNVTDVDGSRDRGRRGPGDGRRA